MLTSAMPTDLLLPNSQKPAKRSLSLPLIVLAISIAIFFGLLKWLPLSGVNRVSVLRQTPSGWQKLPAPKGYLETLQVSSGGTAWAMTARPSGLSRWDGARWQFSEETDLGPDNADFTHEFTLDGEQVWMVTEKQALHWDGGRWHRDPSVTAGSGASIVTGGGEVWVIDSTAKLSHFAGGQWQSRTLSLPGVKWDNDPDAENPRLARTADGSVWLMRQGLWRWDGALWSRVTDGPDNLENAGLLGAAGQRLWLSDARGLLSVSADGKQWTAYTRDQIGLGKKGWPTNAVSAGNRTLFVAFRDMFEFDGSHWRKLSLPADAPEFIHAVAAGSDGMLWIAGGGAGRTLRYLMYLLAFVPLTIMAVVSWIGRRARSNQREQHQRVAEAVKHATGEVPEELEAGASKLKSGGGLSSSFSWIVAVAGYTVVRMRWPEAPYWILPVMLLTLHLLATFRASLVKRKPQPYDPIGPGAPSRYDWAKTWKAVSGAAAVVLLLNLDRFPMLRFLRGYWLIVAILGPLIYRVFAVHLLNRAARRGDYDGALNIIRWTHFYNPSGIAALRLAGHMLLAAGRYREAEDALRRSLASSQAGESYGSALEFLGDALMEQGRYDEAMRSYEAALHAFPWRRRPYRGMAEMVLRRDQNPARALEYVEKAIDFADLSWQQRKANGNVNDDYWALKAWALARMGRGSEAAEAIGEALRFTNKNSLPDLAATHYRAGMAMRALGNVTSANEHFRLAVQFDPRGRRGTLANASLRETSVWGMVNV